MVSPIQLRQVCLLALVAVAQAGWFEAKILGRQDTGSDSFLSSLLGSPSPSSGPAITTSSIDSTTSPDTTSSIASASSTSSVAPQTTSSITPTQDSTSQTSTSDLPQTTSQDASLTTETSTAPVTSASVEVVTRIMTVSGSLVTSLSSSTTIITSSSSTSDASLSESKSGSSGLSTKSRNTVIGVVVGVGGAIILGGLFVVAWRIWGRKKSEDEHDNLMDERLGTGEQEKVGNTGATSPFQSTLENYHNPKVNASSNF